MARNHSGSFSFRPSRRSLLIGVAALSAGAVAAALLPASPSSVNEEMAVYKSPACGCCAAWVKHVQDAGFRVRVVARNDLSPIREKLGAPPELASCHIAVIDGYVVEGHVPADAIKRLLAERPDAVGIFAPGMPLGSPGMESPYGSDPFDVILLRRSGGRAVFASYGA